MVAYNSGSGQGGLVMVFMFTMGFGFEEKRERQRERERTKIIKRRITNQYIYISRDLMRETMRFCQVAHSLKEELNSHHNLPNCH